MDSVDSDSPACVPVGGSFGAVMGSHCRFVSSVGLGVSGEDQNLPYLCWAPGLHKSPCRRRFIAGSSGCAAGGLSCLLARLLGTIGDGLVGYCGAETSRSGVNNMWILKNSAGLLSSLGWLGVRTAKSVWAFDFSALCASVPRGLLESRISSLVCSALGKKDGGVGCAHVKVAGAGGVLLMIWMVAGAACLLQIARWLDF